MHVKPLPFPPVHPCSFVRGTHTEKILASALTCQDPENVKWSRNPLLLALFVPAHNGYDQQIKTTAVQKCFLSLFPMPTGRMDTRVTPLCCRVLFFPPKQPSVAKTPSLQFLLAYSLVKCSFSVKECISKTLCLEGSL